MRYCIQTTPQCWKTRKEYRIWMGRVYANCGASEEAAIKGLECINKHAYKDKYKPGMINDAMNEYRRITTSKANQ